MRFCRVLIAAGMTLGFALPAVAQPPSPVDVGPYSACASYSAIRPAVAPPFRWGSFGVQRHSPRVSWQRDYNGEVIRWSYLRR